MRCHATTHQHTTLHLTSDLLAFSSPHHITLSPSSVLSQKEMCKYKSFCELNCVTHELSWKGEWKNMYVCLLLSHYRIASSACTSSHNQEQKLCVGKKHTTKNRDAFSLLLIFFILRSLWLVDVQGQYTSKSSRVPVVFCNLGNVSWVLMSCRACRFPYHSTPHSIHTHSFLLIFTSCLSLFCVHFVCDGDGHGGGGGMHI